MTKVKGALGKKFKANWLDGYMLKPGCNLVIRYKKFMAIQNYRFGVCKKSILCKIWDREVMKITRLKIENKINRVQKF